MSRIPNGVTFAATPVFHYLCPPQTGELPTCNETTLRGVASLVWGISLMISAARRSSSGGEEDLAERRTYSGPGSVEVGRSLGNRRPQARRVEFRAHELVDPGSTGRRQVAE